METLLCGARMHRPLQEGAGRSQGLIGQGQGERGGQEGRPGSEYQSPLHMGRLPAQARPLAQGHPVQQHLSRRLR